MILHITSIGSHSLTYQEKSHKKLVRNRNFPKIGNITPHISIRWPYSGPEMVKILFYPTLSLSIATSPFKVNFSLNLLHWFVRYLDSIVKWLFWNSAIWYLRFPQLNKYHAVNQINSLWKGKNVFRINFKVTTPGTHQINTQYKLITFTTKSLKVHNQINRTPAMIDSCNYLYQLTSVYNYPQYKIMWKQWTGLYLQT